MQLSNYVPNWPWTGQYRFIANNDWPCSYDATVIVGGKHTNIDMHALNPIMAWLWNSLMLHHCTPAIMNPSTWLDSLFGRTVRSIPCHQSVTVSSVTLWAFKMVLWVLWKVLESGKHCFPLFPAFVGQFETSKFLEIFLKIILKSPWCVPFKVWKFGSTHIYNGLTHRSRWALA